jgi:serine/threonine-protein phosphatase 2A regulatory subunit B''
LDEFEGICTDAMKIPKIFKKMLFQRVKQAEKVEADKEKIPKQAVVSYYKRECESVPVSRRVFNLLAKMNTRYIAPDDFKPLFKYLLETHPGLEFLQATPEFQDRYADTVVMRIFFIVDSNDDDKITWRDFKLSNLMDTFD